MNTRACSANIPCALAGNSPDVVVRYDRQCRRTYVNSAYERINGIPASLVLGKTPTEYASDKTVAGPMAQVLQQKLLNVIATGQPDSLDLWWQEDGGRRRYFELKAVPESNAEGEIVSVLSVARDVSEQRESGRLLSLLSFALDQVTDTLYLADENARLLHVNEAACRILGYSREELLQMRLFDIEPDFAADSWPEHWQNLVAKQNLATRTRYRTKAGDFVSVEVSVAYFEYDGQPYCLTLAQDITVRQRTEEELRRREHEFRALVENSPDAIARYDRNRRQLYANPAFCRMAGMASLDVQGKAGAMARSRRYEEAVAAVIRDGKGREFEYAWPLDDGRIVTCQFRVVPEFGPDGEVVSVLAVGRDISALQEAQLRLQETESMAHIGHWEWDCQNNESRVSAEVCRIFGQAPDWRPVPDDIFNLMLEEDSARVRKQFRDVISRREPEMSYTYRVRCKNGLLHLYSHAHIQYGPDGICRRLIGTTQDISELKNYESRLHEISFHDALTGLPNRALLNDRLRQASSEAARRNHSVGVLVLDLDRFKGVNDTHGMAVGDRLLRESAKRLNSLVRDYDTVARLGGDEFAVVLSEIRDAADLGGIARKILDALACPFMIGGQELFVSASIGISVFPSDGVSGDVLLQYADSALYDAKAKGRGSFRFYSSELTLRSKDRTALEAALRHAEAEGQLELHFQPQIDLSNGRLIGAEALLRWHHPSLGIVPPDKFISIAEDTGLIIGIGAWVLDKACRVAREWNRPGTPEVKVAVNLSPRQFRDGDLVATVRDVLSRTGCDPRWLELEITESLLLDDDEGVRANLQAFRAMGLSIAIDDFGTGYSALSYLKRFPIDVLKIDRSFTNDIAFDRDSTELVKAIITMARSLRLELVAEGIETEAQESFLVAHGCHLGQGYRYGKPMTKAAFEAQLLQDAQSPL